MESEVAQTWRLSDHCRMGIKYHPTVAEALWCEFSGIVPEMTKRRLVIVLSPKHIQRAGLVTVVPCSTTRPLEAKPWHVKLNKDPWPGGKGDDVWVKCDMIGTVCFERLWGNYTRWKGRREYRKMQVSLDELRLIRRGVLAGLGILAPEESLESSSIGRIS